MMQKLRYYSIVIHSLLVVMFIRGQTLVHLFMLVAPLLHLLIIRNDSSCYQNHCQGMEALVNKTYSLQDYFCSECNLHKWIRMRHCYKCKCCVHKYDHHCVLMGICIGEFNHKHYFLFLYAFFVNVLVAMVEFTMQIKNEVSMDEGGVQHLSIYFYTYALGLILLYFSLVLLIYLIFYHSYYVISNQTTWEFFKRDSIPYLTRIDHKIQNPFSKGVITNLKQIFWTNSSKPMSWEVTE